MALCSNDAKSCYDRILLIIAELCLCRFGATKTATKSMIVMLAQLWHHVRTAYGDSTQSQGQDEWNLPTAGIGQGNGTGLQIWVAVSLPLFKMHANGFIATFICGISKQHRAMAGFTFVDNTDLIISNLTFSVLKYSTYTVIKKLILQYCGYGNPPLPHHLLVFAAFTNLL